MAARRRCARELRELRALRATGDRRSAIAARRCALDERAAHERPCLCRAGAPTHGAWRRQPSSARGGGSRQHRGDGDGDGYGAMTAAAAAASRSGGQRRAANVSVRCGWQDVILGEYRMLKRVLKPYAVMVMVI